MNARGARTFDAVVIGGDVDGLVAAATLAGSGSKVLLINESDALGGAGGNEVPLGHGGSCHCGEKVASVDAACGLASAEGHRA